MPARGMRIMAAAALVVVTSQLTPAVAFAAPVTSTEFSDALTAAVVASGVFAPGTTLTEQVTSPTAPGERERVDVTIVNPDGSLIRRVGYVGNVMESRCVRVDRCWTFENDAFPSRRWRLMDAGAVDYYTFDQDEFTPTPTDTLDGDTFDVTDVAGIGRVFTQISADEDQPSPPVEYVSHTWIVNGSSLVVAWSITDQDGTREVSRRTLTSSHDPVAVPAPTTKALPDLRRSGFMVHVNGCGGIPPSTRCS